MDDKKFALFSKALLLLYEGYFEEHGCTLINPRVVLADPDSTESEDPAGENRTA